MAYADYDFYTDTFFGSAIAEADFDKYAQKASELIDRYTFQRAADDEDNETAIKNAMCAVANELYDYDQTGSDGIQAESVGRLSVTYSSAAYKAQSRDARCYNAAKWYLDQTGLMCSGFKSDEYGG